jgi:hypothetical protein
MLSKIEKIKEKSEEAINVLCDMRSSPNLFSLGTGEVIDENKQKEIWLDCLNTRQELKICIDQLADELKTLKRLDVSLCERLHENMQDYWEKK